MRAAPARAPIPRARRSPRLRRAKPLRVASNGRLARSGVSLSVDTAEQAEARQPTGLIIESKPPASTRSTAPRRISFSAVPSACRRTRRPCAPTSRSRGCRAPARQQRDALFRRCPRQNTIGSCAGPVGEQEVGVDLAARRRVRDASARSSMVGGHHAGADRASPARRRPRASAGCRRREGLLGGDSAKRCERFVSGACGRRSIRRRSP